MNTIKVLGFNVSTDSVGSIVTTSLKTKKQLVVNTINPHSYVEQKNDEDFKNALHESDIIIPDGSGIVIAAKVLQNVDIIKIAGYDLFWETMSQLNRINGRVFFLGSTEDVLLKISVKAKKDFPNVEVKTLSPDFKSKFDNNDVSYFAEQVAQNNPHVVFIGLTAPKQEKLIRQLKAHTNVQFLSGIGAVFDFYAGTVKRPGKVWIKLNLEWLPRLLSEPRRLWKRNFISTPIFIYDMLCKKFSKR